MTTTPTTAELQARAAREEWLDRFCKLLRTIDPAALNHEARAALIDLLGRALAEAGVK